MKRKQHRETEVWHDPNLAPARRPRREVAGRSGPTSLRSGGREAEPIRTPRAGDGAFGAPAERATRDPARRAARIIVRPEGEQDPAEQERERLLGRLLAAEGRGAISTATQLYLAGGFELPPVQEVWLQVLEHRDEGQVAEAIRQLGSILGDEPPKRRAVLESRLRRIEDLADDAGTRAAASDLRRRLTRIGTGGGARAPLPTVGEEQQAVGDDATTAA